MSGWLRDLTVAMRALLRARVLAVTSIATLALGIGLSVGVLAVVYGVLLRPLPYADSSRVVIVTFHRSNERVADVGIPLAQVEEWRRRSRAFGTMAGYGGGEFTLRGAGDARTVHATMVTDGFFEVLGVAPARGTTRDITAGTPVAAIGHPLAAQLSLQENWATKGLTIGARSFTIGAVLPRDFTFPTDTSELWLHADAVPGVTMFSTNDQRRFQLVARLAPGVTHAQAQRDAERVAGELNADLTEPRRLYADVQLLEHHLRREVRATLIPLAAGALLVLLIACANVSGLLAGRAAARHREFAVRRALGGDTWHVLRASIAETALIAVTGWVIGLWVAHLVIRGFEIFGARTIQNLQAARLDGPMVLASFAIAAVMALLSGAVPAIRAIRADPDHVLKSASQRLTRTGRVSGDALVVAQIALTVVLLVSAGLLTRTVMKVLSAERGFEAQRALAMQLMLTETTRFQATERAPFLDRLVGEVRALPGVVAAGVGSDLPPNGTQLMMTIRIVTEKTDEMFPLTFGAVTPGYLQAVGATLVGGRFFEERDRFASPPVAVITESAVRKLMPAGDPIGREWPASMPRPGGKREKPRVIGVIRDVKYGGLDRPPDAGIFLTWEALAPGKAHLVVRTAGDPDGVAPAVRRVVQQLDPSLPQFPPQPLEEVVSASIVDRRLRLQLAVIFAALALALASVALWGAIAQGVLDRRRELAIRLALGSTSAGAVRLMLRTGAILIAIGLAAGIAGAVISARTLRHMLVDVKPLDPLTFGAGIGIAALVSVLACYLPARRAAAISPAELLRDA